MTEPQTNTVDQASVDAIEAEVKRQQAAEYAKKASEDAKVIEDRVRKEMTAQQESEKLKAQLKSMEDAQKKASEDAAKAKTDLEAKMKAQQDEFEKKLADALAGRRGLVVNPGQNPFESQQSQSSTIKQLPDGQFVDLAKANEIEEESRKALMQAWGIKNDEFGRPVR